MNIRNGSKRANSTTAAPRRGAGGREQLRIRSRRMAYSFWVSCFGRAARVRRPASDWGQWGRKVGGGRPRAGGPVRWGLVRGLAGRNGGRRGADRPPRGGHVTQKGGQ